MIVKFIIDENDFLEYQLYQASKSIRIQKKRLRSRAIVPIFYVAFASLLLIEDHIFIALAFVILGFLWFIAYPFYDKKRYKKHYKDFIQENYSGRIGKASTIEFGNELIISKDEGGESKIFTSEIDEITEIPSTIFVKLKSGQSFILPKKKIQELDSLTKRLQDLAGFLNIKYVNDAAWVWK